MNRKIVSLFFLLGLTTKCYAQASHSCTTNLFDNPQATISDAELSQLVQSCRTTERATFAQCVEKGMAEIEQQNKKTRVLNFLAQCDDISHDNYKKAISLLASGDLPEAPKKPPTPLPDYHSASPWLVSLTMGTQFLPDYENGKNNGLDKSMSFGEIIIDHREAIQVGGGETETHWGATLTFEGYPIHRNSAPKTADIKFNDIAETVTAGLYYVDMGYTKSDTKIDSKGRHSCWLENFLCNKKGKLVSKDSDNRYFDSKWGLGYKVSVRSREKLGEMDDSVDEILEAGIHYRYNEYEGAIGNGNVMPKATLSIGLGYWNDYEDYLGINDAKSRWRVLAKGEYRLSDDMPIYIGFKGNIGHGADSIAAYLSLRIHTNKLIGLIMDSPKSS